MWGEEVKCEQNMGSCWEEFIYWERDKMPMENEWMDRKNG
jgi:hypothetical protein